MSRQITRRQPAKLNSNVEQQEFVPAAAWLNIGYEVDGKFFSLRGAGVPFEKLEKLSASATSPEDWQQTVADQNSVIADLEEILATLEPGEAMVLPLAVEIRKPAVKGAETSVKPRVSLIQR